VEQRQRFIEEAAGVIVGLWEFAPMNAKAALAEERRFA